MSDKFTIHYERAEHPISGHWEEVNVIKIDADSSIYCQRESNALAKTSAGSQSPAYKTKVVRSSSVSGMLRSWREQVTDQDYTLGDPGPDRFERKAYFEEESFKVVKLDGDIDYSTVAYRVFNSLLNSVNSQVAIKALVESESIPNSILQRYPTIEPFAVIANNKTFKKTVIGESVGEFVVEFPEDEKPDSWGSW